ncbi:HAD-like protein [Agrocybe pediades]|nr:HAD-like protein [Agrocybe pediades]
MNRIRLVTFDALHTTITPRRPIHVQYSEVFEPYVGILPPERIKQSFKSALKAVQNEDQTYEQGAENWWRDVIRRTAIEAGANPSVLDKNLSTIVKILMRRFSSSEGYGAFEDAIPTIQRLDHLGVKTAVISNGDSRIRAVLKDLSFPEYMSPIILSEEEGVSKPSPEIFMKTLKFLNRGVDQDDIVLPSECLHVGDELVCDYHGAMGAGMNALLLRRLGIAGEHENKEHDEDLREVQIINSLDEVQKWVEQRNTLVSNQK